ncbi:MAG: amidohydrolase/deacetylase family metallohydrolase [Bryobacteraceae bacterium]|nr:amidohydrolase/deacetylase family metallohydrolase [Bryobacteraceae bacterium]
MRLLLAVLIAGLACSGQEYDLVLRGGHVIDAKNGIDAVRDVALKGNVIAAVAEKIDAAKAKRVVDAKGLYVTPGLIDIHTHVYTGTGEPHSYAGDNSVYPDGFTFRVGVTTVVDAGGSGWRNFPDFQERVIRRSKTRVLSMLNIVGNGMRGGKFENNQDDMDAEATAKVALANKGVVVGIKTAHYSGPEWTPVERAVAAGTKASIPVMVDFGTNHPDTRPLVDLLTKKLRPGDIYTHMYSGLRNELLDNGQPNAGMIEGRKRGVIFDVGHGGGSFVYKVAIPLTKAGFWPDSISTDLHIGSMNAGMKDQLNVMSKFLNLGMPLKQVIAASTWNPAREIKQETLGNLSVGAPADIAVLRLEKGNFGFTDHSGMRMKGNQKLTCEITFRDGVAVYDLNGLTKDDWKQ